MRTAALAALSAVLAMWCGALHACPADMPLTVVVPYAAGGSLDVITRIVSAGLGPRLARRVDVVNLPGASGLFAARRTLRTPLDGCTLLSATISQVGLLPLQNAAASLSPEQFQPVARTGSTAFAIVASARSPIRKLDDLGKSGAPVRAGNLGSESLQAILLRRLEHAARADFIHVPYAGAAALAQAIEGDHIDIAILAMPAITAMLPRGHVRIVARVGREHSDPAVSWSGLFAAKGTDEAWAGRVALAIEKTLADPAIGAHLARLGVETQGSAQNFADEVAQSIAWLRATLPVRATER